MKLFLFLWARGNRLRPSSGGPRERALSRKQKTFSAFLWWHYPSVRFHGCRQIMVRGHRWKTVSPFSHRVALMAVKTSYNAKLGG